MKNKQSMLGLAILSTLVMAGCATSGGSSAPAGSSAVPAAVKPVGDAGRPQLSDAQAAQHTPAAYFARGGNIESPKADAWDPVANGIGDVKGFKPVFTVAADGSGTHKNVQEAIDAAMKRGGKDRIYILVKPGTYRGQVCVKGDAAITLYGMDADAGKVVLVDNKSNGTPKEKGVANNACESRTNNDSFGTSGSSSFFAYADNFQAKNLTFANDFDESSAKRGLQAVAITTRGDKLIFENVRFLGNQDTLQPSSSSGNTIARSYFSNVYIEGDVDYVFGRGVAVFDKAEFKSLARDGSEGGYVLAPSHSQLYPYGFLVMNSKFTSDGKLPAGTADLGRAWDDSSGALKTADGKTWLPNGMVVVRDSAIGAHIDPKTPWAEAASTKRAFSSDKPVTAKFGNPKVDTEFPVNRLFEYRNTAAR